MVKRVKPLQQAFPSYGPECRNRQDILDQVKGERVSANSFKVDGRHLIWHTTPEELNRVALEFEGNCQEPGESTYVSGGQYGLTLQLPERTVGLEISTSSSYYPDLSLEVTPSALKRAAKRLATAPWDKRPKVRKTAGDMTASLSSPGSETTLSLSLGSLRSIKTALLRSLEWFGMLGQLKTNVNLLP